VLTYLAEISMVNEKDVRVEMGRCSEHEEGDGNGVGVGWWRVRGRNIKTLVLTDGR
jgi:hypothetical protein